jgi:hypothetical protein
MRYHLRTLLIVLAILPPLLAGVFGFHYGNYRAYRDLRSMEVATWKRDALLETWRVTYARLQAGKGSGNEELETREQYFAARADVEKAREEIHSRYGGIEAAMQRGAKFQPFEGYIWSGPEAAAWRDNAPRN